MLHQTYAETRPIWTNARGCMDTVIAENGLEYTSAQATIWRWREVYQHDFAARMDWCVAEKYEDANHNPVAAFQSDRSKAAVNMTVKSGDRVRLNAAGTYDPDGDEVSYHWFVYKEAGSYDGSVRIEDSDAQETHFVAPRVRSAKTIHVVLEVKDDGQPSLYSFRRIVVSVNP